MAKIKTTPDIDATLADIEAIERNLPSSASEIGQRRAHLQGELRVARESLKDLGKQRATPKRQAEIERLSGAIADREQALANMGTFNAAGRRDAGIELLAHVPRLQEMATEVNEPWGRLMEYKFKNALGSAEFAELERLEALRARIGTLTRKASAINGELQDLVPPAIEAERKALQAVIKALADVPVSGVAGDAAQRVKAWATSQLSRLAEATKSQTWDDLARFEIDPF